MKAYKIKKQKYDAHSNAMIIINRETGAEIAEYRLTPGYERAEIAAMRRAIERHLDIGGGLGNYQW